MSPTVLAVLVAGLVLRVILAIILPPGYDEAYYVLYGQNPSLSYFDHPLAVGLWSWLGQHIALAPWAMRIPGLLSYTAASFLLTQATTTWFGYRSAWWLAALTSLCPLVLLCGGVLLLPDSPLILSVSVLLWWLSRHRTAVPGSGRESLALALILAALTLSKYQALLLLASLLAWTLVDPGRRCLWRRHWPWCSLLGWVAFSAPLWLWNVRHGWASFAFHAERTLGHSGFQPEGSLLFLLSQIGMLFPTIGVILFVMLWPRRPVESTAVGLLRCLAIPQLLFFVLLAGRMQVMASWLVPAWWITLPLAADWLARNGGRLRWIRLSGVATAVMVPALLLIAAVQARWGVLETWWPTARDPSAQLMDPDDLRLALEHDPAVWSALQRADVIASHRYEIPGFLALALGKRVRARYSAFTSDPRGFAFWAPSGGFQGHQGVLVAPLDSEPLLRRRFPDVVGPLRPIGVVQVRRAGRPSMTLEVVGFGPLQGAYPWPYGSL
jgi:4-amino-4-deoxy-L-arabinose transferase-like glycosyltransferase